MDMNGEHVKIMKEYGVLYPNGTFDWNTASWFGSIDTPEARKNFQEQYDLRMQGMGAVGADLQFVTRIMVHSCTPYTVIDDGPADTPEPETPVVDDAPADAPEEEVEPPVETPPVVDDAPADAPEEEVEPPVDTPPVEEESPVEDDEPADTDADAPDTDDERVAADGR